MNYQTFNRLHSLRMDNDSARYAQEELKPRFDRLAGRATNGAAPRAVSAYQLFQTPPDLAARMVELADIQPHHHALEPSAGLGRILVPLIAAGPASVTACELDATLAGELFRAFPNVTLAQGDFLARRPTYEGNAGLLIKPFQNAPPFFDRIVMNPPFHMRSDIAHILHAKQFLATGGKLVALCMATRHRLEKLKPLATHWEEIPAGTFSKEGTGVACYLLTIQN